MKLDLFNSVAHVCIDGGKGSLKIIMNVFDPKALDFLPRNQKYTRVNKVIILGTVQNVEKNHHNLNTLSQLLHLNQLKFTLASDLKAYQHHPWIICKHLMSLP